MEAVEIDRELVRSLRQSKKRRGAYYPILLTEDGRIFDGFHRFEADENWFAVRVPGVKTEEDAVIAAIHVNWSARGEKSKRWKRKVLRFLAERGYTPRRVAEETGLSYRTLMQYWPEEFKEKHMKVLARRGAEARAKLVSILRRERPPIYCPVCRAKLSKERVKEIHEWVRDDPELYTVIRKYPGFEGGK